MEEKVIDALGQTIEVGARVQVYGFSKQVDDPQSSLGVVTNITELDGDVNDYGRPVAINPSVWVRFDDGSDDSFGTSWTAKGPGDEDAPYQCDDLELEVKDDDDSEDAGESYAERMRAIALDNPSLR